MNRIMILYPLIFLKQCRCCGIKGSSGITCGGGDDVPLQFPTPLGQQILDISSPDSSNIIVSDYKMDGVRHLEYIPMRGSYIGSIVHAGVVIWKADEGEKCTFATSAQGISSLLLMYVSKGSTFRIKCFESNGGEWKGITEDEFEDKLEDMEKKVRNPSENEGLASRLRGLDSEWVFCPYEC